MTAQQLDELRQQLIQKGYTTQQIDDIIQTLPPTIEIPVRAQLIDPLEQLTTKLLDNPAIQNLINNFAALPEKQAQMAQEEEKRFFDFLKGLDIRQKLYNIGFMAAGCGIVYLLKKAEVIGIDTATTLATLIIGASLTDAIASFMKHQRPD